MQSFKQFNEEVDAENVEESMTVHLKPHASGSHYIVHKLGSQLQKQGGLKKGEKISDTEVDSLGDSGIKVKHLK